ncbi:ferric reductase-like transmembrane domain-containing protein [Sulfitobacter sp. SK012]|uniref:ferric reductase-like transmembrane domain-containing protein n=1 Tax=Sulfitobacter sp. SK012 TaxID=1389005 RepID=UPI0020C812D9|nr:ferric reductase-like transmembrane domain-containing protein [Sulfitobacter sp. SK012]
MIGPFLVAAQNPLLASRSAAYVTGGMAGITALALLLIQPLLAAGYLPGVRPAVLRRWHKWVGIALVSAVAVHVGGLYLTSPPDALDALLLVSPTPFSVYGVVSMWAVVLTAILVAARHKLRLKPTTWKITHNLLALAVVIGAVVHALMIEGAMGATSKIALCICVLATTGITIFHLRILRPLSRRP